MSARLAALWVSSVLLISAPNVDAAPPAAPTSAEAPRKIVLPNGLEVFIVEDHRVPSAVVEVGYRVGPRDDPPARRGLAELFKLLLERPSTRHLRDLARADAFKALGLSAGPKSVVQLTDDATQVVTQVPVDMLDLALFLEADRMGFLSDGVAQEGLDKLAPTIGNEEVKGDNVMIGSTLSKIRREMHGSAHPYGRLGIDLPKTLDGLTMREVFERKRDAYGPGNATLVVLGDFDADRVEDRVKRFFGPLLATPRMPAWTRGAVSLPDEKRLTIEADVPRPVLFLAWPTPPLYAPDDIALDVVARILRERLHSKLTMESKATIGIGVRQASRELSSFFYVMASVNDGHEVAEVQRLLEEQIRQFGANPPANAETVHAGLEFATNVGLGQVPMKNRAIRLDDCWHTLGDLTCYDQYIAGYLAVSPADVQRVAARHLHPTRRIVATVLPSKDAPPSGRLVGGKQP